MLQSDIDHWQTLSLEEQLGNIGSEVSRAITAQSAQNFARRDGALSRMIDLFIATKSDIRWRSSSALREICRASEVVCDYFFGDNEYGSTPNNLMNYFDAFARVGR